MSTLFLTKKNKQTKYTQTKTKQTTAKKNVCLQLLFYKVLFLTITETLPHRTYKLGSIKGIVNQKDILNYEIATTLSEGAELNNTYPDCN